MDFTSLPLFGAPLNMYEVYFEFDGPRTFALRSVDWSIYYLANAVEESDENSSQTFLLVMVPEERFRAIRSGTVSFREAYESAGLGTLYAVEWRDENDEWRFSITPCAVDDVPGRWLPNERARLNLKTSTVAAFDRSELRLLSNAQNRTLFAIEVEAHGRTTTEFPTRRSGELQIALQGQLDALASEYQGGAYTASRDVQTTVMDLRAASFVLVLAVDNRDTLVERVDLTSTVLERLSSLIAAASSEVQEVLFEELAVHTTRVRNRFRDLLMPLVETGSGLALSSAVLGQQAIEQTRMTSTAVAFAHEAIVNVVPTIKYVDINRATVVALHLRLNRFELFDNASAQSYQGYMSADASSSADGLIVGAHSFVSARLRVEWEFDEDAESGVRYILEAITPVE